MRVRDSAKPLLLLFVLCLLAAASAGAPAASAAADEAAWMYDPDAVVEISLGGLSTEEIEALENEPDEYQPGTFELKVDGVAQGPPLGEVGIRLKGGNGSFRPLTEKAAFKVKFDEYVDDQVFFGLERLTLNNMVQDPSMLHEALTYELVEAMGLPGSRTGYALVRVNDQFYGVYLNLETLDKIWLPRWFATTQHLYEADTPKVDVYPGGAVDFEVDRGDDEDLSDLEALIAAANSNVGDWSDGMAAVADLQQMTREWAVERYVGHWDGYAGEAGPFRPNNYYLHSDASGLFTMLPWGADQTWEEYLEFDEEAGGILFNRCYEDASCQALYVEALEDLYGLVSSGDLEFDDKVVERAALLAPHQALEEEGRREYDASEIATGVEDLREFIADRPQELADWLEIVQAPQPDPQPEQPPVVGGGPTTQPPLAPPLRFRASLVADSIISARVALPAAGRAHLRVTARLDGAQRLACTKQRVADGARELTLRCRLSKPARVQLESSPLKLRIQVSFHREGVAPQHSFRSLTAPRLRGAP